MKPETAALEQILGAFIIVARCIAFILVYFIDSVINCVISRSMAASVPPYRGELSDRKTSVCRDWGYAGAGRCVRIRRVYQSGRDSEMKPYLPEPDIPMWMAWTARFIIVGLCIAYLVTWLIDCIIGGKIARHRPKRR